jgi:hypothetical protein
MNCADRARRARRSIQRANAHGAQLSCAFEGYATRFTDDGAWLCDPVWPHLLTEVAVTPTPFENRTHTSGAIVCMSEASIESDGIDVFVVYNGVRIAKRGQPNSPQAGAWVSLEPGFRVLDKDYPAKLVIERDGKIISD